MCVEDVCGGCGLMSVHIDRPTVVHTITNNIVYFLRSTHVIYNEDN